MKKSLKYFTILACGLLLVTGCGKKETEKEKKETDKVPETVVNTETEVVKDQTLDEFSFTNTSLVYENGITTLVTEVKNNSAEAKTIESFNITIKDKDGETMEILQGYVGQTLEANETTTISSGSTSDLSKAGSVEYSYR